MHHVDIADIHDEAEEFSAALEVIHEAHLEGETLVEAQHLLRRIMNRLVRAVDWHSGLHFEPDFDINSIEH